MIAVSGVKPVKDELDGFARSLSPPPLRGSLQFALDELVIPEGETKNERFRLRTQPWNGLLLREMDNPHWYNIAVVGCVQSGKSLFGFVVPVIKHLFENGETVILGVPTVDEVGRDKWTLEILPVIRSSGFAHLLPRKGPGSQGGFPKVIVFKNGATLKVMGGTGGDEKRSSFTARVVVITEADKMDTAGEVSREADPITQMAARSMRWDIADRRLFMECTVSHTKGRIWQEYTNGSESRIACPCPYCREYVTPERASLRGWEGAADVLAAERDAYFVCPACEHALTTDDRRGMNRDAVLVHRGQSIDAEGTITGEMPPTRTLGFRWNAFNNMFWSPGAIGVAEWRAERAEDEESADREMAQFYWTTPWDPPEIDMTPLDPELLKVRHSGRLVRGQLSEDITRLTMGVDLHKKLGYWTLLGWRGGGKSHIVDYGVFGITTKLTVDRATLQALRKFRTMILAGWTDPSGAIMTPAQVWIDSGYAESRDAVYGFCLESAAQEGGGERFRPCKGYSATQEKDRFYKAPTRVSNLNRVIGEGYYLAYLETPSKMGRVKLVHVNADHWKSQVHQRLSIDTDADGAMTIWRHSESPNEHNTFFRHILAQRATMKPVPDRGDVLVMVQVRKADHWLDSTALAAAAGHSCGEHLAKPDKVEPSKESWFAKQKRKAGGRRRR